MCVRIGIYSCLHTKQYISVYSINVCYCTCICGSIFSASQTVRVFCVCLPDQQRAQEQMLEIMPLVIEVNAMAEVLDKHRTFEVVLIPPVAQEGGLNSTTDTK